ncbi:type III PLP-dependent enzyme [Magnetovibrio sp. PR-2]|uniref:type III PLP-dependent enzyme n=1 Tax=Magnetovibrio sp. PR-2 TaxID=3120356 RepID=UPI002FCE380F
MTPKIEKFLAQNAPQAPCLVVDMDVIEGQYVSLDQGMADADIYYAVKANPAPQILQRLVKLGAKFDAASLNEIQMCLDAGATPDDISYGNTLKKADAIQAAHELGITLFAFDSEGELDKIAEHAPGAKVYCRILTENGNAEWPLSRKFGCVPDMAVDLLASAPGKGLVAFGLSFHVGSQQPDPHQWGWAINHAADVFQRLFEKGVELQVLNMGGGFPAQYRDMIDPFVKFAETINAALVEHFGENVPALMIEPGRAIVAEAGVLMSEVVLVSKKREDAPRRWVYLDVGMFGGLAETMGEAIKYNFITPHDGGDMGPVAIAGPTCDGADILYEQTLVQLPLALKTGDRVLIEPAGAYTTTYASVGFNGFLPMDEYYI